MLSIDDLMILGFSFIRLVTRLLRDMRIIAFFYILDYYFFGNIDNYVICYIKFIFSIILFGVIILNLR